MRCDFQGVVDDINKHGGVDAHQLVPVYHTFDNNQERDATAQAECTDFTQDHPVFDVVDGGLDSLDSCLEKSGVVQSYPWEFTGDGPSQFRQFPYLVEASTLNVNRQAASIVQSASRLGYFTAGARIGIVSLDQPGFRSAVTQAMIPALAADHVSPTDTTYVSYPQSVGDYSAFSSAINGAVLKFASDHIDHVMILDRGGNIAFFFMDRAQSQDYHPRYGLGGASGNTSLVSLLGPNASSQLNGVTSNGWMPAMDLAPSDYHPGPAAQQCLKVTSASGAGYSLSVAENICAALYSFKAAVEAGGPVVNAGNFIAGINKLGTGFAAPDTLGDNFSQSEHDAAAAVGDMNYVGSCSCFRYVGAPQQVPE
jgi:hypothetical protein